MYVGCLQVQALVAARGIALDKVACDPWAIHACPREWLGRRLMQVRAAVLCSWRVCLHALMMFQQLATYSPFLSLAKAAAAATSDSCFQCTAMISCVLAFLISYCSSSFDQHTNYILACRCSCITRFECSSPQTRILPQQHSFTITCVHAGVHVLQGLP
jgi:hypothetical protein